MPERKFKLHNGMSGAAITVRVIPRASVNEISEILDDGTIKVRLTAGPGEARTNRALLEFLSEVLQVPIDQVEIVAGENERDKLITVNHLDAGTVHARVMKNLA